MTEKEILDLIPGESLTDKYNYLQSLIEDERRLRLFAENVMEFWPEDGIDVYDLHDVALEHGLITSKIMSGPCDIDCPCENFPVACFKRTPLCEPRK